MKKLIVMLVLLVAATVQAADPNDGISVWGTTTDAADSAIGAYLGLVRNNVEIGGVVKWDTREPWNQDVDMAGAYLMFHIPIVLKAESPNPAWDEWAGYLCAKPVIGVEGLIPTSGRDRSVDVNWLVGTLISLDPQWKTSLAVLYTTGQATGNGDDDILSIGARIKF